MLSTRLWPRRVLTALIATWVLLASSAHAARARQFSLELIPANDSYLPGVAEWKLDATIRVLVVMTNNTKREVDFSLTDPGADYVMEVRDASGRPVPESEHLRELKKSAGSGEFILFRRISIRLKPGQQQRDSIELSHFYDFTAPGQYTVRILRKFPQMSKRVVRSNRLVLTISP